MTFNISTKKFETYIIIPDSHVPGHSQILYDKLCRCMKDIRPDGVVILGDFLDLYSLSHFNKDSFGKLAGINLSDEYEAGNRILDQLDSSLQKGTKKKFCFGNHEARYQSFLDSGDAIKLGNSIPSPDVALKLRERGYEVKTDWKNDFFLLGKHLEVIHGTFYGDTACKQHVQMLETSVIFGHSHRIGQYVSGKRVGLNIGHLCDINNKRYFGYISRVDVQRWCPGFGLVYIDNDGDFQAQAVTIYKNRFIVNQRMY